jgi:hypothetical protein
MDVTPLLVTGATDRLLTPGYGRSHEAKEGTMYGSMGPDLARQRMQDRMREAEAYRLTKDTRAARAEAHRVAARRVVRTALTSLLWPIKH